METRAKGQQLLHLDGGFTSGRMYVLSVVVCVWKLSSRKVGKILSG